MENEQPAEVQEEIFEQEEQEEILEEQEEIPEEQEEIPEDANEYVSSYGKIAEDSSLVEELGETYQVMAEEAIKVIADEFAESKTRTNPYTVFSLMDKLTKRFPEATSQQKWGIWAEIKACVRQSLLPKFHVIVDNTFAKAKNVAKDDKPATIELSAFITEMKRYTDELGDRTYNMLCTYLERYKIKREATEAVLFDEAFVDTAREEFVKALEVALKTVWNRLA